MDRQLEQRQNIISEFISTEKAYLDKLKTVLEVYITPLRESNILDQTDLHLQFGHWEMIYGIHKDLYAKMIQQQQSSSGQVNMGKLFSDFSDYLRVYKTYVANFEVAMTKRAALVSSNRRFSSFLDRARSDPRCVAGIESLIIIPIQRIPRYRMLLEQLLKYTSQLDPEYNAISESLSKVSEAANINNEAIKVQENKRYIMEVMMAIEIKSRPNLLDNPNRRLLKCGSLRRQIKKGKSEKEFMFWLFSDKLIYGEPIPGIGQIQYSLNRDIPLAEARVRDYKVGNGSDADYDSGFTVESTVKSFVVYAQ